MQFFFLNRHIDTAFLYGNEVEVGNAIRAKITEGVIKREDIFVTTKVMITFILLSEIVHTMSEILNAFFFLYL